MYRVWYYQNNEWNMVSCGKFADYAWRVLEGYLTYSAYLEFIK